MNEDLDIQEFERYISEEWFLRQRHYTIHGERSFWEYLWDESLTIQTLHGLVERVDVSTDYDEGREGRAMVVKIGESYFRKTGYYDSWESSEWDGPLVKVMPVEKTVITYEQV